MGIAARDKASAILDPSINRLMAVGIVCLLVIVGIKVFFDNLQDELNAQSANERARLFVGEEIVSGIRGIEKDVYLMAATSNLATLRRISANIARQMAKLKHDLAVLESGGTVRRQVMLNIEGIDEMAREATFMPRDRDNLVMEMIEIEPLLDQVFAKTTQLEEILLRSWELQEKADHRGFFLFHDEIDAFLKHMPPYFARLDENANRLFFDSSERLRELENALARQRIKLKQVEIGLVILTMILAGLLSMLFLRRINIANQRLESTLDEMRAAKDAAERASRAKSEFVSRMSHELRTPLNAIIGFAELLEAEPLSPSHHQYVSLINNSGKHLMELINAVLDHAKIEAGGMTLERIAFDFPAMIEAVRSIVSERATAKGLAFVAAIDPGLPRHIRGDPTRLRQILINLLVNAVKFTENGSIELRIAPEDNRIFFSVRDTGIGMDAPTLSRLFKPFSQADDSVTRKYGGTGLGLLISKELIEAMGGGIEVESASGVGTVFWFWLPLEVAAAPGPSPTAGIGSRPDNLSALLPGPVLLVDDNRVNQQLAGAMLERLGLAYAIAENGEEALRRIDTGDFALVLMDMEMPVMDGVTATRQLREKEAATGNPALPVIAMTANALQEDRERCFAAGMDGYIAKPVSLAALQNELLRQFGATAKTVTTASLAENTGTEEACFDRARAIDLMGDEALFAQLAQMYIADSPGYLAELEAALAAADGPRLTRAAHTLKGLFATFAARQGELLALELEQRAQQNPLPECGDWVVRVRAQAETLAHALGHG